MKQIKFKIWHIVTPYLVKGQVQQVMVVLAEVIFDAFASVSYDELVEDVKYLGRLMDV